MKLPTLKLPTARLRRAKHSPVGVDVDGACVRAAQVARARDGTITLHAATEFALPASQLASDGTLTAEACQTLRNVLRRRGFAGDTLALCAPVRILDSDLLELPETRGPQDTHAAVRSLISRAARCTPSEFEVAYWPRKDDGSPPGAYAVAVRHADAMRLVTSFEDAGLDVVSMGCAAAATGELLHYLGLGADCSAVLRLGLETHLVLLCVGREVVYQRTLDSGGLSSAGITAADLCSPEPLLMGLPLRTHLSSVATEISATLDCVPRTFPRLGVARLLLSGPGSASPGVAEVLAQALGDLPRIDPAAVVTPAAPVAAPRGTGGTDVALGLALAEVSR